MAAPSPTADLDIIIDTINALFAKEQNSMVRFLADASPLLTRTEGEIRRPLVDMVKTHTRHCNELYRLIEYLGGIPLAPQPQPAEQYMAFLSLHFLLPELISTRHETIAYYNSAIANLAKGPAEARDLLTAQLKDHQRELAVLEKAQAHITAKN